MKLVQILLPLRDNRGRQFKCSLHERVRKEITDEFGGLTAYTRSPARGVWKTGGKEKRDDLVILEIMSPRARHIWWKRYRHKLERRFKQEKLIVRIQDMALV